MIVDIFVVITAFMLLVKKYLDCDSTAKKIHSISNEQNPIARYFMNKFGIKTTIWLFYAVTVLIVLISVIALYNEYNNTFFKVSFIIMGLFISLVQFSVAQTNRTGRVNSITRKLLNFSNRIKK
jgi:cytochrome b subunit of formate dehydrogenase